MLSYSALFATAVAQALASPAPLPGPTGVAVPDGTPVHVSISLRLPDPAAVDALLARQQDPASPDYRRWLTAAEFGQRFGQPTAVYQKTARWLASAGLTVTPSSNRLFIEGQGLAYQVENLLGLHLSQVVGRPASVHVPDASPSLPEFLQSVVLGISGLDTRTRTHHRLLGRDGNPSLGPQDLRRFYDSQPLLDQGFVGQHQKLVVLSEAETSQNAPSQVAIEYYLRNISNASAVFSEAVLDNPQNDFDQEGGGGGVEFALDSEMQSVGAPGADSVTLVVPPASEVFTKGVNYIVNTLDTATAVSISLGLCELGVEQSEDGVINTMQQLLKQGLTEGQTWSAASGDNGVDDCRDGQDIAVDFPASIPQMVAVGGTQVNKPSWDANNALTVWQTEEGWNGGNGGGAGGGGYSLLFPAPSYQQGAPFIADGGRALPDIALIAGDPGVLYDDPLPGPLQSVQGTSVASPLSAGFFALIASRVGCRLGDVHATLYALGNAQLDGGAKVFHDVTAGTVSYDGLLGPRAAVGYDAVAGWGSLDVKALAEAWPPCPDAGTGVAAAAYDPCEILGCSGNAVCDTLPEGPSSCIVDCDPATGTGCGTGSVCSGRTVFSVDAGVCVAGCKDASDCGDGGNVCSTCEALCQPAGKSTAKIGDACTQDTDCQSGGECLSEQGLFQTGYCTQPCSSAASASAACSCPSGSACDLLGFGAGHLCLQTCTNVGDACGQVGNLCQPGEASLACLPACQVFTFGRGSFDTCLVYNSPNGCNTDSGVCSIPPDGGVDAGVDAGGGDGGEAGDAGGDAGITDQNDAGTSGPNSSGHSSGCSTGEGGVGALWGAAGLFIVLRRRRSRADAAR